MMKATAWFCPVLLTLLCATRLVCTAQRGTEQQPDGNSHINGYPLDYLDARNIQDDFLLAKRNKPSLSIVNPLDVLRQRLLLEIARRQMKENTRQVELNRAILKNVGKRVYLRPAAAEAMLSKPYSQQLTFTGRERALAREEPRSNKRQQKMHWTNFPSPLQWSYAMPQSPDTSQSQSQKSQVQKLFNYAKKSLSGAGAVAGAIGGAGPGLGMSVSAKHPANGYEVANEKYHENHGDRNAAMASKNATIYVADTDEVDDDNENENDNDNEEESRVEQAFGEDKPNLEPNGMAAGVDNTIEYLPWNFLYRYLPQKKHYNDI